MKTPIRALGYRRIVLLLFLIILSGCGTTSQDQTSTEDAANQSACPVGNFITVDRFGEVTFTATNVVFFNLNRCKSRGFISSCVRSGGNGAFQMKIESEQMGLGDYLDCARIGDYYCEFSTDGAHRYILYCPEMPETETWNELRTGRAFQHN